MKTKILMLFLCFLIIKANGQNLRVKAYGGSVDWQTFYNNFGNVYDGGSLKFPQPSLGSGSVNSISINPTQLKSDYDVIIVSAFQVFITQQRADALIQYVKLGGILLGSLEAVKINVSGVNIDANKYIGEALLCYNATLTATTTINGLNVNAAAYHPNDGNLLLNTTAPTVPTTQSYSQISGLPSENIIMTDPTFVNSTNCSNIGALDFIVPAYPTLMGGNNSCGILGFAILSGESCGPMNAYTDVSTQKIREGCALNASYSQLIYDFLNSPSAIQTRISWALNTGNVNSNCKPNLPFSNSCLAKYTTPVTGITGGATQSLSGLITYTSNKSYYLANDITIVSGAVVTFNDAEVLIADGTTITVEDGATLNINGSHLYSCEKMWVGIQTEGSGIVNITKTLTHSSFIEDAQVAVNLHPIEDNIWPNLNSTINNTIFNRNNVSISVNNLVGNTSSFNNAFFSNLFTSRKIDFSAGLLNWPSYTTVTSLVDNTTTWVRPNAPQTLNQPFIKNLMYDQDLPEAFLKDKVGRPKVSKKPDYGIIINQITQVITLLPASIPLPTASSLDFSSPVAVSIFDNLDIGIATKGAYIDISNCIFQNPHITCPNGIGLSIDGTSDYYNVTNVVNTNKSIYNNNCFFNLNTAIEIKNIGRIEVKNNVFRSNRKPHSLSGCTNGNIGINLGNSQLYYFEVFNNEFTNLNNGILLRQFLPATSSPFNPLTRNIKKNIFQDILPGIKSLGFESFNTAIQLNGTAGTITYNGIINIDDNTILGAARGIVLNKLTRNDFSINSNIIKLKNSLFLNGNKGREVYGIGLIAGNAKTAIGASILNNTITGNSRTSNQTGIYLEKQSNVNLGCNTTGEITTTAATQGLTHGFRFNGKNTPLQFYDNMMYPTSQNGITIENVGSIGRVGKQIALGNTSNCTSNNSWGAQVSDWSAWGRNNTLVNNSTLIDQVTGTINSQLIVSSNIWMNPYSSLYNTNTALGGSSVIPFQTSTNPNKSSIVIGINDATCIDQRCTPTIKMAGRFSKENVDVMEDIASGNIDIPFADAEQRLYAMQEQLYSELKENETLIVNEEALQQFLQDNQWSSFDYIYYTKRYQEANNTAAVDMLLDYFPSNNIIDDNYFVYYNWINQMQKDPNYKPQLDEVLHLANQCPDTYGSVVYDAQNLYMQLINDIYYFDNNCESQPATAARKVDVTKIKRLVKTEKINTDILVYPNPSNGIVNIKLPLLSKGDYAITITDGLGKVVDRRTLKEGTLNAQLNMAIKGMYFVNITNIRSGLQKVIKLINN